MTDIKPMRVKVEGRGEVTLNAANYARSGGEAAIFQPSKDIAIKIWTDPAQAKANRSADRITILRQIADRRVIAPKDLVFQGKEVVGFTMPWINGTDLPLMFTNQWQTAAGFTMSDGVALMRHMRDVIAGAHQADIVLGDGNEFNILVKDQEPRYIDVDAWVPNGFQGHKILPSIKDELSPPFSREADWFALAVIGFQLLVGIHPYRGTHPSFGRQDMAGRIRAKASVFDPAVKTPPHATRPITAIPGGMRRWLEAVLAGGERTPMPSDPDAQAATISVPPSIPMPSNVARVPLPGRLAILRDGTMLDLLHKTNLGPEPHAGALYLSDHDRILWAVHHPDDRVTLGTLPMTTHESEIRIRADRLWNADNRLFAIMDRTLQELVVRKPGTKRLLVPGTAWNIPQTSTTFFDGAAIWNALGAMHLVIPIDGKGVVIARVRELDDLRVIDLRARGEAVKASAVDRSGNYHNVVMLVRRDRSGVGVLVTDGTTGSLPPL